MIEQTDAGCGYGMLEARRIGCHICEVACLDLTGETLACNGLMGKILRGGVGANVGQAGDTSFKSAAFTCAAAVIASVFV